MASSRFSQCWPFERHRRALEHAQLVLARELAEGDHRAAERDRADGGAEDQLEPVAGRDRLDDAACRAGRHERPGDDAERIRLDGRRDGDEHRRQADHAVHEGDQLRHLRHLDALGHRRADGAADHQAAEHVAQADRGREVVGIDQLDDERACRQHGDGHAGHAEGVAADRGRRVAEALQRLDEADARDQVEQRDDVQAHGAPTLAARAAALRPEGAFAPWDGPAALTPSPPRRQRPPPSACPSS